MELKEFNKIADRYNKLYEEKRSNYEGFSKEKELKELRDKLNNIPEEEFEKLASYRRLEMKIDKVIIDFFKKERTEK